MVSTRWWGAIRAVPGGGSAKVRPRFQGIAAGDQGPHRHRELEELPPAGQVQPQPPLVTEVRLRSPTRPRRRDAHASDRRADEVKRACPSGSGSSTALLALGPCGFRLPCNPGGVPKGAPTMSVPEPSTPPFWFPTQKAGVERRSFRGCPHPNHHPSHAVPRPLSFRTTLLVSPNQLKHQGDFHPVAPTRD